jgi:DNA ligase (NAD+)
VVIQGFKRIQPLFQEIYALGFTLKNSQEAKSSVSNTEQTGHPLAGKTIVFTGTMVHGSRDEMKQQAKEFGAKVGDAVSSKTDLLVIGEKVGATKLQAAQDKGVKIVTEQEYLKILQV